MSRTSVPHVPRSSSQAGARKKRRRVGAGGSDDGHPVARLAAEDAADLPEDLVEVEIHPHALYDSLQTAILLGFKGTEKNPAPRCRPSPRRSWSAHVRGPGAVTSTSRAETSSPTSRSVGSVGCEGGLHDG